MKFSQSDSLHIQKIFKTQGQEIAVRVDKFFSFLLLVQWFMVLALGLLGPFSAQLFMGTLIGTLLCWPSMVLTCRFSGRRVTRYVVGFSQMGFSMLFSWMTEGRMETQIHVFVSLATLAFYQDSALLIAVSSVAFTEYLGRALGWDSSAGGIQWKWFELIGWVLLENIILVLGIRHLHAQLWEMAASKYLLETSKEDALRRSTTKSNFLSRMSHEIRTPLNSIIGFTDILKETHLDVEQKGFVNTIQRCSDSLLRIINDVLDIQKIESGLLQIDKHHFDIREFHEDIHNMFAPQCEEKGVKLELLIDERSPRIVEGDSHRLRQVLVNLVGNAVKFTDKGQVTVEVNRQPQKQTYEWKVKDTGRGIDPKNIPKLFRSYYQEDASMARKFGGSGLGLMISKNLIEMMGGGIQVESRQGEGTTFLFSLPMNAVYNEASE